MWLETPAGDKPLQGLLNPPAVMAFPCGFCAFPPARKQWLYFHCSHRLSRRLFFNKTYSTAEKCPDGLALRPGMLCYFPIRLRRSAYTSPKPPSISSIRESTACCSSGPSAVSSTSEPCTKASVSTEMIDFAFAMLSCSFRLRLRMEMRESNAFAALVN